jgi:hypothetical protein
MAAFVCTVWFLTTTNVGDAIPNTDDMAELGSSHKLGSKADIRRAGKDSPNTLGVASNERFASRLIAE